MPPYWVALVIVSLAVACAETMWPWRPAQRRLRPRLVSDLAFLVFNGHFLGVGLYWLAARFIAPHIGSLDRGIASHWPLWLQALVFIVAFDFIQWCTHRLLHRVPVLWTFHKVHHSVVDGEMDFIVSFRFHWIEAIVYKSVQYVPLALLGFSTTAAFIQAVVGTLVGHLNHANLNLGRGPLRYVVNSARMHLWHHDYDLTDGRTKNFGIIFSAWDWLFGTAYLPDHPPRTLGYPGVETMPDGFVGKEAWPAVKRAAERS